MLTLTLRHFIISWEILVHFDFEQGQHKADKVIGKNQN